MSTDEVQKLLLSSGNDFIKLVESRYQEPIKQIAALEKRIATLRNPRNLSRASKGVGAWTQYHQNLIKAEGEAKKARAKVEGKVAEKLDKYNEIYTEHEQKARNAEAISRRNSLKGALLRTGRKEALDLKLAEVVGEGKDEASKAQLFVLADLLKDIQNEDPKDQQGQKNKALAIKHIKEKTVEVLRTPGVDMRFSVHGAAFFDDIKKAKSADPISYLANSYKDYRNPNYRSTILANPTKFQFIQDSEYGKNFDIPASYVSYQDDIDWVRSVLRGERGASSFPGSDSSVQEQKKYIESAKPSGLTVDEGSGRVIVDPEASEAQKQTAEAFLKEHTGKKNPTYAQFVTSKPMREMATGTVTGQMAQERMRALADELEDRKETLVKVAVDAGRLTPAQQSVLTNVLFPRAGYRRTPRYGLLKRRAEARKTLAEIEEAEADEAAEVEEVSAEVEAKVGSAGVPIVPGIINRFKKAYGRATTADDSEKDATHREFTDVVNGFKRLPADIQSRFPRNFVRAVYELGTQQKQGKDDTPEQQQMDFASAIKSLDDAAITTKTIGEYVADVGSDPNATALESTADMVEFLNHPDSVGEGSSVVGRKIPVGSIAFDFLDTMNQIEDGSASRSDLMNVFAEAQELSQQDRPDFFDTDKYGRYESVDNFVAAMDRQRGGIARRRTRRRTEQDRPSSPSPETPRTPESYASASMQEMIAEFEAGPEDEAPEVQIPELKEDPGAFAQRQAQRAAELQASDEDRRRRSERAAITGTDDSIADRVLRDSTLTSAPRRTVDPEPQADPGREQRIADFNARPGQAPHGSVFSVVSPKSQETDDDQSLTEADEAAIARADKKFREKYGPGDPPVLVDGQFTEADSSKPGPGNTGALVNDVPTALDLTPEQQLAQTQASLPGGSGPRVGDRDEDVQREDASRVASREARSRDNVSKILVGLREQVMGGNVDIREANRYLNDLYESPNVDKDQLGLFQNSLNEEFQAQQILNEEFQAKQIPMSGVNQ